MSLSTNLLLQPWLFSMAILYGPSGRTVGSADHCSQKSVPAGFLLVQPNKDSEGEMQARREKTTDGRFATSC